jgi:FxsC-like protein
MAYEFFLSYTRANNDPYLKQFFDELSQVIRDLQGAPASTAVGFFDQRELELGEDWDAGIVEALQTAKVVVPVFSPCFFKSEYCGKELALFRQRCEAAVGPGKPLPPLIKPVIWIPLLNGAVPPALAPGQYTFGDPQALHNVRGFKYLLKQLQMYRTDYNDLTEKLAQEILAAGNAHPLKPLPAVPRLRDVPSLWTTMPGPSKPGGAAPVSGPKHVRFVYVAADPAEFGAARSKDPYVDSGGADWKPFLPACKVRIHRFVQNLVSSDELDFTSEELPWSPRLIEDIRAALDRRHIVVLIVDGWSVHWKSQYRDVLKALDERLDYHWCVLVPWNDQDADSVARRAEITATINQTFDRHANLSRNPMFYRDGIKSTDELTVALREVLTYLKDEIRKRAPVNMPVPAGPAKSVLTAQG